MQLKHILNDDDAVSPVIGVILMVAITVILAAVIGTFVLGLGDQVSDTTPQASFTFDFDESVDGSDSSNSDDTTLAQSGSSGTTGVLTITHDGGDEIARSDVEISDGDTSIDASVTSFGSEISAGDAAEIGIDNDDTIRVVFLSSDSGDSATLGRFEGPEA